MALAKFYKRKEKPLSQLEEQVGKAIMEVEKASADNKALLKGLLVDNVKEVETTYQGKKSKNILLITVPYVCLKAMHNANKVLIALLEKKLNAYVTFTAKRTIQSKWIKTHKSQMRPRSRTLT
jgi:small subunit ribosomal protein S7e